MQSKCGIIVPVFQQEHTALEIATLLHNITVLKKHRIFLVIPKNLHLQKEILDIIKSIDSVETVEFEPWFLSSINGYNSLMLSKHFYSCFSAFQYILICQLDAIVFYDDLDRWMAKGYSYVGAPWLRKKNNQLIFDGVGNGGLSLRKIDDFLLTFKSNTVKGFSLALFKKFRSQPSLAMALSCVSRFLKVSLTQRFHAFGNEDNFWGNYAISFNKKFLVPKPSQSIQFCFEVYPSECFKILENKLPMGTHAWQRYELEFWLPFIPTSIKANL